MKRTIAIVMATAIAAGAAFAQDGGISFSGGAFGGVNLVGDNNREKTSPQAGGFLGRVRIQAEGETETGIGTFGAWARFDASRSADGNSRLVEVEVEVEAEDVNGDPVYGSGKGFVETETSNVKAYGYAWWQPIDQLKLLLGANPDGHFGGRGNTGWNFYADADDLQITVNRGSLGATSGGMGDNALMLTVTPMEMLEFNFAVPFIAMQDRYGDTRAWNVYRALLAEVAFNLDFGRIMLGYKGHNPVEDEGIDFAVLNLTPAGGGSLSSSEAGGYTNYGAIRAYLNLTSVENLGLNVGVRYVLPGNEIEDVTKVDLDALDKEYTKKVSNPFYVGLAAQYDVTDAFGLKTRLGMNFLGDYFDDNRYVGGVNAPFRLQFDILPYYNVNDNVRAYLNLGMLYVGGVKHKVEISNASPGDPTSETTTLRRSTFDWHVNPYVSVGIIEGTSFYAGFKLYSDTVQPGVAGNNSRDKTKSFVNWAVPIGMIVNF